MDPHTLEEAIESAQRGDTRSFRAIFDILSDKFFTYAVARVKNRDDALDIVQEAFIDLWKALARFHFESTEAFFAFSFTILKRKISRSRRIIRKLAIISIEEIEEPSDESHPAEDWRHLESAIEKLPAPYAEILRLRYWSSLSFAEIGAQLLISENTAKVRHHRAIKALQTKIDKALWHLT